MSTGFELLGYHGDENFIKVSESICHWVQNAVGNCAGIDFTIESKKDYIEMETFHGRNIKVSRGDDRISLTLTFHDKKLYNLFQLTFHRNEYEKYIISETVAMSQAEFERWKND